VHAGRFSRPQNHYLQSCVICINHRSLARALSETMAHATHNKHTRDKRKKMNSITIGERISAARSSASANRTMCNPLCSPRSCCDLSKARHADVSTHCKTRSCHDSHHESPGMPHNTPVPWHPTTRAPTAVHPTNGLMPTLFDKARLTNTNDTTLHQYYN
jgi:hypothetical protein